MKPSEFIAWVLAALLAAGLAFTTVSVTGAKVGLFGVNLLDVKGLRPQLEEANARNAKLASDLALSEQAKRQCLEANAKFQADVEAGQKDVDTLLTTERAACAEQVARYKKALQSIEKVTHVPSDAPSGEPSLIGSGQLRDLFGQAPN